MIIVLFDQNSKVSCFNKQLHNSRTHGVQKNQQLLLAWGGHQAFRETPEPIRCSRKRRGTCYCVPPRAAWVAAVCVSWICRLRM